MQCNTFSAGEAATVPLPVESGFFQTSDQASLNCLSHSTTREVGPLEPSQKSPCPFPNLPPSQLSGGVETGTVPGSYVSQGEVLDGRQPAIDQVAEFFPRKKDFQADSVGLRVQDLGWRVFESLFEVSPLRSSPKGGRKLSDLFPLPTSKSYLESLLPDLDEPAVFWMMALCCSLNSLWGDALLFDGPVGDVSKQCLKILSTDVSRFSALPGILDEFSWGDFFATRGIDYKGDEVKTARSFCWNNIRHALPAEVGRVPLEEVCTLGARHYVLNFDAYIKDQSMWVLKKAPRVMVSDADWPDVCRGLLQTGVCTLLPLEEVFDTGQGPLLNGLFGVSKEEWVGDTEVYRLIMNLIPLNNLAHPLRGDVETLPMWSLMNPYFLQPGENLLISSEDVRCFFYTMSVPCTWYKYMAFNKRVPRECLPEHLRDREVYLAAKVLPMGFLNSVALAQHVHRNLTLWSGEDAEPQEELNPPEKEIRKDRPLTVGNPSWRIYLDNYDLLEKVKATGLGGMEGTLAPSILALRQEYERWEVPRNMKKSVSRQLRAEVQGAQVDGERGIAYPRESKLLKYLGAALSIVEANYVTQKQLQVVCGGLVYFSMFRRPILGCLNSIWNFIDGFDTEGAKWFPPHCKAEVLKVLGLLPLARLDFRVPFHEQVTCSDASTTGGGICASHGCSPWGQLVARGSLRGELPELRQEHRVLTIGLFDGIGALRVAADLLGLQILGHVSVEVDKHAARVAESHFPEVCQLNTVQEVDDSVVREWARTYSQASVVLLGAGPPCQGVSGLNHDRKGALKDERSRLFTHVPRIRTLVQQHFPWCQVHTLMESVASMDTSDRKIMSQDFGDAAWKCDAGQMTWCSRPRLYWVTWELTPMEGVSLQFQGDPREVILTAEQDLELVCQKGWIKVDPSRPFPTFTTARPRKQPGRKPAGIKHCTNEEVQRWADDSYRFPPYQYTNNNLLVSKSNELRLPSIEEKEFLMGFPIGYTIGSVSKKDRNTQDHLDIRHSLIGNSWSVPVVAWFLSQLFGRLGLCKLYTPQELMDLLTPSGQVFLQSRLWRKPLRQVPPLQPTTDNGLVPKLANLISIKGEDILLTTPSSQLCKFHRLRASVPSRLWRWRIVTGWKWKGNKEHINALELRAVLTTLKWRIQHRGQVGHRFLHLVDSLVVLHSLARGRSSSRKLRPTLARINALLLCSSSQALWGYVHTDQNPADKPSRWGKKIRTKFRNA